MEKKKKKKKKKKNQKKFSFKEFITSDKTLLAIFCILVIVVVTLFGIVLHKKNEMEENPSANMVIPIYKDASNFHFSIHAKGLFEKKQYIFKVTNYRNKKINDSDVHYKIIIENDTDSKIKVSLKNKKKNLMTDDKKTIIDGGVLSNQKEEEDIYYVSMISPGKLDNDQYIRVEVSTDVDQES